MEKIVFWCILTVVLLVIEATTVQLVTIWFAAGSFVALIASLFSAPFYVQTILFVVVSVVLLIVTIPLVRKFKSQKKVPTNADRVIGQVGFVAETIDNLKGQGQVKMGGITWSARNIEESVLIPEGTKVVGLSIEGVTLIVRSTKEKEEIQEEN